MNQRNTGVIQAATTRANGENAVAAAPAKPIDRLKSILAAESVQEQFRNVLAENSGAFVASIIDLYNTDKYLQACDPKAVVMEALKGASLKLPINKQLGHAWIVPYRDRDGNQVPTFQIGWKGYVQLCMRTGAYRHINADVVYEGELVKFDKLSGEPDLTGERKSDKVVGYFAFIETLNGFRKTLYMTVEEVTKHAQRYSKSYSNRNSAWATNFDDMAKKTCLRLLLSKYGIMSIEMQQAVVADSADSTLADEALAGSGEYIDLTPPTGEAAVASQEPAASFDEHAQETLHV